MDYNDFDAFDISFINCLIRGTPLDEVIESFEKDGYVVWERIKKYEAWGIDFEKCKWATKLGDDDAKVFKMLRKNEELEDIAMQLGKKIQRIYAIRKKFENIGIIFGDEKSKKIKDDENKDDNAPKPEKKQAKIGKKITSSLEPITFVQPKYKLNSEERRILEMLANGASVKDVAASLGMPKDQIRYIVRNLQKNKVIIPGLKHGFEEIDSENQRAKEITKAKLNRAVNGYIKFKNPTEEQLRNMLEFINCFYGINIKDSFVIPKNKKCQEMDDAER